MSLQIYSKDPPIFYPPKNKRVDRYFYAFIGSVGIIAIIFAAWPFFVWQVATLPRLSSKVEDIPVPKSEVLSSSTAVVADVQVVKDPDGFSYFVPTNLSRNLSAHSGLSSESKTERSGDRPQEFSISIPKIKIKNATAKVDSLNFRKTLAHFPGTALPGEVGNSFITGHSVLPQFNDPNNYKAIFTKLDNLEIGDKISVEIEGKKYQYIVQYSKVVDPRDTSVLAPISESGKNLTLMTCVPPGTNIKRLVVITSLI